MEKRKYDLRNKRSFVFIVVLSILIICIFSLFIYKYIKSSSVTHEIVAGSVIQDVLKNYVQVDDDAELKMKWNGNYYLKYKEEKIDLAKNLVSYNMIDGSLKLYGDFYEINEDGKVIHHTDETVLENTTDAKFYKLGDREYLLVDTKIFSEDKKIEANNYLLVELDKSGNAKLSNNDLNLKTIVPTKLITSKYTFDINNEILSFGKEDINLKKIIGSTNQYVQKEEEKPDDNGDNNGGNVNTGIGTNTGDNQGDVINNIDQGDVTDIDEIIKKLKMTSIIRIVEGLNQIDVDYVVYDPYNEYKSVYVEVVGNGKIENLYLNRSDTHITINNLAVNTDYKLNFIYTTSNSETGELIHNTFDSYDLHTLMPKYSISIYKISKVDNRLIYKVNLDDNFLIRAVNVTLEFDYREVNSDSGESVIKKATLSDRIPVNGVFKVVTGDFDISNYSIDSEALIKLTIKNVETDSGNLPVKDTYSFKFGR